VETAFRAPTPTRTSPSAATIAAGLHGVTSRLKAPKLYEGNAYEDTTLPQVPKTLREAIAELERSRSRARPSSDRVVDHYLHTARLEQQAFDQVVTDLGAGALLREDLTT